MISTYNRSRVMRTAHAEWRAVRHKPGMTFGRCLKLAHAVERKRAAGPVYYQPPDVVDRQRASLMRDIPLSYHGSSAPIFAHGRPA